MFISITPNPAMDYILVVDKLSKDKHNLTIRDYYSPGGKGIHTARLVAKFDIPTLSITAIGGGIGRKLILLLNDENIYTNTVVLGDPTRTDVVFVDVNDMTETTITTLGPKMEEQDLKEFFDMIDRSLTDAEVVFMGGSVPPGAPDTLYHDIILHAKEKGVKKCIVTARGKLLENAATAHPFVIKPDTTTHKEYFGHNVNDLEGAIKVGEKLIELGAENAVVSFTDRHDVLINSEKKILYENFLEGPINVFGTSEALLAGISIGLIRNYDIYKAVTFGMGLATKVASLKHVSIFDFSPEEIETISLKIKTKELG